MAINWYRLNRQLHRDIGYFCIGLTIVFAVSGIAVNHNSDWNPNYQVVRDQLSVAGVNWDLEDDQRLTQQVLEQINEDKRVKAVHWVSPSEFKVFLSDASNISLNPQQDTILYEHIEPRTVLKAFNRLHLNEGHPVWVFFSDLYAAMLLYLAIGALFMVKGKYSPWGRKSVYLGAGIVLPMVFALL